MNAYKRILAALAALILCVSLSCSAWATDAAVAEDGSAQTEGAAEPVAADNDSDDISFEDKSWDEIMDALLAKHNTTRDSVAVAYVNLVSGEEYFINPDVYMVAASMYKLPLNMFFTEAIHTGEFDWDAIYPFPYEEVRNDSIIYSDNNQSMFLYDILGGYEKFRLLTSEYMGTAYESLDPSDVFYNRYTAREFASCLKYLYDNQENFPGMIETMQQAEPERFFKLYEPRFKVAHKYGYYSENGRVNMNDCGIAFTSEPIALVMFTQSVPDPEPLLTEYCTIMCEYTEYLVAKAMATPEPTPSPEPTVVPEAVVEVEPEEKGFPFVAIGAILIFVILGMGLLINLCIKYHIKFFWLMFAVIFSAAAMLISLVGMRAGTVYAKPSGDPGQCAVEFMDSICSGSYDRAYALLRDYSDLGLENVPETAAGQKAYEALHASFSYELNGECSVEKLEASQPISFSYLDLTGIENAVVEETPRQLKLIVESRSMSQVYDSNKNYLPEVTEEAYLKAVTAVLANAESYYKTIELKLDMSYSDGRWQILTSPALLRALNGGAGY